MNGLLHLSQPAKALLGLTATVILFMGTAGWLLWKSRRLSFAAFFATCALGIIFFGISAASPKSAVFGSFIWRGPRSTGVVALTFDDGPDPTYTPAVLSILARYNAKATFFMLGERVRLYPDLARSVAEKGHAVGSHCYHHVSLLLAPPRRIREEIAGAEIAIQQAVGQQPRLLRPPYGFHPPFLVQEARRRGYLLVGWSISPHDSFHLSAAELAHRVLARVRAGDIILLHDGRGNRAETIKALPLILEGLRKKGLHCVTIPQLMGAHTAAAPAHSTRGVAMVKGPPGNEGTAVGLALSRPAE